MIKINLLAEGRRPVVARRAKPALGFGGQDPNNLLVIAGLVVGALVVGGWWYQLNAELTARQRQVKAAQRRYAELEPIIKQVEEFKRKNEDLERKVNIIKDLKAKQKGPVRIMDQVSRALPELVWLEDMSVIGTTLNLRGKAFNTNAVAAFIENLVKVEDFEEPDPKNIQVSGKEGSIYDFQMSITLRPPKLEEEGEGAQVEGAKVEGEQVEG